MARVVGFGGLTAAEKSKTDLKFELGDPNEKDDKFVVSSSVTLAKDGDLVEGATVVFLLDFVKVHEDATDDNGMVAYEFSAEKGNRSFTVRVVGGPSKTHKKTLKSDKPTPKVASLTLSQAVAGNTCRLTVSALAVENAPVKGALITAVDLDDPAWSHSETKTGPNGIAVIAVTLSKPRTRLEITAPGIVHPTRIHVYRR